jgi:ABC-type bacteriocin/lantibiotic exporter with double-glycine peptidase domain
VAGPTRGFWFARLREALGLHIRVDVEEPTLFGARLEQLTKDGQLVLVATKGERAHCVIVEAIANNWVLLHDPGNGEPIVVSLDSLAAKATGDVATIHIL